MLRHEDYYKLPEELLPFRICYNHKHTLIVSWSSVTVGGCKNTPDGDCNKHVDLQRQVSHRLSLDWHYFVFWRQCFSKDFFFLAPSMSDGGEKSISRTLKLLLETKKQYETVHNQGLQWLKVFLRTYISESQNRQQIYWLPKKKWTCIYWLDRSQKAW